MLLLDTTTALLKLITSAACDVDVHVSYVDFTPGTPNVFGAGAQHTNITTATTTTILASPTGSIERNAKSTFIRNVHASTAVTTTITLTNGTLEVEIFKATLAAGESLIINGEGVPFVFDVNGGVKMGASAATDTLAGLVLLATVAEMEAAASVTSAVTPGRLHRHPGVAKSILHTTGTATPVAHASCTYGCTITDTGVGQLTVNFNTTFSNAAAYCVLTDVEVISTTLTAAANVMQGYMRFGGQAAANSCQVNCCDRTATTNVIRDPISWHVVTFGDV